uniref:Uncharacterized protein n=1 Tax=Roseihalotalea indica TaxID=2867963 RepID=A0AA49GQV0_9BACT|nr:hypothetical protein K4G66_08985 [Tunicatimonas sp. TK19036]
MVTLYNLKSVIKSLFGAVLLSLLTLIAEARDPVLDETPLAVVSDFQAVFQAGQVSIHWVSSALPLHRYFVLERAGMDMQFKVVANLASKTSPQPIEYQVVDSKSTSEFAFYRLVSIDAEGNQYYHGVITKGLHSSYTISK